MAETKTPSETINEAIDFAHEIGDKDECFIKHVGHTLSAIYVGNGYKNVPDYPRPGQISTREEEELGKKWEAVEKTLSEIGGDKFKNILSGNPHAWHFNDGWYIDEAQEHKKRLEQ